MFCYKDPLFLTCCQQGPFLSYYRDKKNNGFKVNEYLVALFAAGGKQIGVFDEIAVNDYMSTLAITKGTLPAGKYSIMI